MNLSDFGSIASIVSLIAGFSLCKFMVKYNFQFNKLFSFFNSGTISQKNEKEDWYMMKNLLNSIFNFGDISQNNTIIVNTLVDTQLNQIKRTFSEGKISISFNDIITAKKEHI